MSITDMIKKSVLEGFRASDLTTTSIAVTLGIAMLLGMYIYFVYRITTKNGFYNRGFNKSLATLPVITAGIMLAMQSNLVISLGMVGALSIVRFRNAVKDPADLMCLFWSISMGIIVGAGLFELAALLSLCVTVLVIGLDLLPTFRAPCLLVISGRSEVDETQLLGCVKAYCRRMKVRSRNVTAKGTEWILEMQVKNESELVKKVWQINGVESASLMSYDGEVRF